MSDLHWKSAITKTEPNRITIRGYQLDELIGRTYYHPSKFGNEKIINERLQWWAKKKKERQIDKDKEK